MTDIRQHYYIDGDAFDGEPLAYTQCGLDNVFLLNGFERCEGGAGSIKITDMDGLHQAIGLNIVLERKAPTGKELRFLRAEMDKTQAELADLLGVSDQTVARWEKGATDPEGPAVFALRTLYILSLVPEPEKARMLNDLLHRLEILNASDEHDSSITLHYTDEKWAA